MRVLTQLMMIDHFGRISKFDNQTLEKFTIVSSRKSALGMYIPHGSWARMGPQCPFVTDLELTPWAE